MDLVLRGELADSFLSTVKKGDSNWAQSLAKQWFNSVELEALSMYLLDSDHAVSLLADRLKKDPQGTLKALDKMPPRQETTRRRGRPSKNRSPLNTDKGRVIKRRKRLTAEELAGFKKQIVSFLNQNPWSSRNQITTAVKIPSAALYNRIISELKSEKALVAKGKRSKTLYAPHGMN